MTQETTSTDSGSERAQKTSTKQADLFDQLFNVWEKRTSEYFEKLLRNPAFLNTMGGIMNSGYRNKVHFDRAMTAMWRNLNLPNKQDQERTLHLLNELHSRIYDLEEKITLLKEENERLRNQPAAPAEENTKGRSRRAQSQDLKSAGAE